MVQRTYGAMTNDVLISIPLFVLMGYVMERGALVDKMFYSIQLAFRRVPASLAVATLIVCTFWGIASGLVGAVVVLMGVIAFNPMLRAGYDVKLASGVITAGGTLGILIPPSVMIIVYAAVAGQSVVKLYAAAMFPGFFLALLYVAYIIGWAIINPKIAPPLPEEQTRVPVPDWMRKFQAAYSKQHARRLCLRAGIARARQGDRHRKRPPELLDAGAELRRVAGAVHHRRGLALAGLVVRRHPSAGRGRSRGRGPAAAGLCAGRRGAGRPRAADRVLHVVRRHLDALRADDDPLLLAARGRPARGHQAAHLVGDAARHPHRRRAGRHPVRHHDGDGIRRRRRRGRVPAGLPGADARLEAHQGGGVPDRQDHRDGVLAVRRLGAVLRRVRDPRRPGAGRADGCCRSTCRRCSS